MQSKGSNAMVHSAPNKTSPFVWCVFIKNILMNRNDYCQAQTVWRCKCSAVGETEIQWNVLRTWTWMKKGIHVKTSVNLACTRLRFRRHCGRKQKETV